jgi:hypothetical protein
VPFARIAQQGGKMVAAVVIATGCRGHGEAMKPPDILANSGAAASRSRPTWAEGVAGVRWTQRLDTSRLIGRVDGAGNVLLAANLDAAAEVGGRHVRPHLKSNQDVLVAALTPEGVARWTTVLGSDELDNVEDMVVDERGFVTVTGGYGAPLVLGGQRLLIEPAHGPFSSFLARLDAAGAVVVGRGPLAPERRVLGATEAGALVASGWADVHIHALDGQLNARWGARCTAGGTNTRPALAGLAGGAVFAADVGVGMGCFGEDAAGRASSRVAVPGGDVMVARILEGGEVAWAKGMSGEGFAALAVSSAGRIALGTNAGDHAVVRVLDTGGGELAIARFTSDRNRGVRVASVAMDAAGGAVVWGDFEGTLEAAGSRLAARGRDLFLARLAPHGEVAWARRFGDEFNQFADAVVVDPSGDVIVTGREPIREEGDRDSDDWFVIKLSGGR